MNSRMYSLRSRFGGPLWPFITGWGASEAITGAMVVDYIKEPMFVECAT
jgi:hypothetical protein